LAALRVAKAADEVVVDESRRLHVRVNDRRADELEAAAFEILRERVGLLAGRRHVALLAPAIHDRLVADEAPNVTVERAELFLDLEEAARIRDGCSDLLAVADDTCILHQLFDRARREPRDLHRIELRERAPVAFTLAQDRPPAQARLRGLEDEELEVHAIVSHGHAPFLVVIAHVGGVDALAPRAPHDALLDRHRDLSPCRLAPYRKPSRIEKKRNPPE